MDKTECHAYNANYEVVKRIIGYAGKEPIYAEDKKIVDEFCSAQNSYFFDCSTCPVFKARERREYEEAKRLEEEMKNAKKKNSKK